MSTCEYILYAVICPYCSYIIEFQVKQALGDKRFDMNDLLRVKLPMLRTFQSFKH